MRSHLQVVLTFAVFVFGVSACIDDVPELDAIDAGVDAAVGPMDLGASCTCLPVSRGLATWLTRTCDSVDAATGCAESPEGFSDPADGWISACWSLQPHPQTGCLRPVAAVPDGWTSAQCVCGQPDAGAKD